MEYLGADNPPQRKTFYQSLFTNVIYDFNPGCPGWMVESVEHLQEKPEHTDSQPGQTLIVILWYGNSG